MEKSLNLKILVLVFLALNNAISFGQTKTTTVCQDPNLNQALQFTQKHLKLIKSANEVRQNRINLLNGTLNLDESEKNNELIQNMHGDLIDLAYERGFIQGAAVGAAIAGATAVVSSFIFIDIAGTTFAAKAAASTNATGFARVFQIVKNFYATEEYYAALGAIGFAQIISSIFRGMNSQHFELDEQLNYSEITNRISALFRSHLSFTFDINNRSQLLQNLDVFTQTFQKTRNQINHLFQDDLDKIEKQDNFLNLFLPFVALHPQMQIINRVKILAKNQDSLSTKLRKNLAISSLSVEEAHLLYLELEIERLDTVNKLGVTEYRVFKSIEKKILNQCQLEQQILPSLPQ